MIAEVGQRGHPSVALARQRVVFTAKTELPFAGVGGKQTGCVIHSTCKHAVFIMDHSARWQEGPLKFHTLLSGECEGCGAQ